MTTAVLSAPKARTSHVDLIARVRAKNADLEGWVDRRGLARIRRGVGKVDVFVPARVTRGVTTYKRRLFLAPFLSVVERHEPITARVSD